MSAHHLTTFHGLPVFDLPSADASEPLPAADSVAWRLRRDWDDEEDFDGLWRRFLDAVRTEDVRALVIGAWDEEMYEDDALAPVLQAVLDAKDRFPRLRAFFLADLESEENEISWIQQQDLAPLLEAFPTLEELGARGAHRVFTPVQHASLRRLRLESGGLAKEVVHGVSESKLPALEYLELWLGSENYGGDTTVADLAPLLAGDRFPALRHLGLQDSEIQDEIAAAVAAAPVVPMLTSLSLSMGVLTDTGAEALLHGQPLTHLERLDLHHHFLSDGMMQRLREALEPAEVELDLSGQSTPHQWNDQVWHYVAVSE
ncbi:STM4015 family protein [Streptacidiphilus melanogenes]|uniref:STM4015 family protein n=1 Tax=Streptacidiphilus melanogenes TaxID=411235 RepID=UPI0005A5F487|nr:STM4015 family protein [Streptacidiphilus melanogenes]